MYKDIRYKKKIGSRRLSGRPKTLKALTTYSTEAPKDIRSVRWETKEFSYADHPTFLMLPIMPPPGLARGLNAEQVVNEPLIAMWTYIEPISSDVLTCEGGVYIEQPYNHDIFMRLLAKTAHCLMVAEFDLCGFEPFLLDIIIKGDLHEARYYIGGEHDKAFELVMIPTSKDYELGVTEFRIKGSEEILLGCFITLFANLRSSANNTVPPTYFVIVGKKL